MKITGVRTVLYEFDLARPISDSNDPTGLQHKTNLTVFIDTDAAITGVSMGSQAWGRSLSGSAQRTTRVGTRVASGALSNH